jgi:hypothetical protein
MARLRNSSTGTVVTARDNMAEKMRGYVNADETGELPAPVHVCGVCGFEAKSAGGLGAHRRRHEEVDDATR